MDRDGFWDGNDNIEGLSPIPQNSLLIIKLIFRVVASHVEINSVGENNQVYFTKFKNATIQSNKMYSVFIQIYVHPSYGGTAYGSDKDIAIIELPDDFDFNITPVTLAKDYQEKGGDYGIAAGYGIYKYTGE